MPSPSPKTTAAKNGENNDTSLFPKEVKETYKIIRKLGTGGFANVMLARHKSTNELVALKSVKSKTKEDMGYAHREIDILQELSHDHIMKVLQVWEDPKVDSTVMALSYAKGLTIRRLLQHGGALSLLFGRVVTAQVVDTIAYLHSRAVIHRDIKPDNIIVTGATLQDDTIWNDVDPLEQSLHDTSTVEESYNEGTEQQSYWQKYIKKWQVTLVDFGFARALTPQDVQSPSPELIKENMDASYSVHSLKQRKQRSFVKRNSGSFLSSTGNDNNNINKSIHSNTSSKHSISYRLDISVSKKLRRSMSALGNKNYAAPEILKGMHQEESQFASKKDNNQVDIATTISRYVSDYGLLVDAFSLGCTIKYMMTGVPPSENVTLFIANHKSIGARVARYLSKKIFKNKNKSQTLQRKVQYRHTDDLPGELYKLIRGMTQVDPNKRTSVRAAKRYPWIQEVLPNAEDDGEKNKKRNDIKYLQCVLNQMDASTKV